MDLMFVDFVNSEWYDGHGRLDDRLLKPQWLSAFGRRWGFGGRRLSAPDEEHAHSYFRPESGPLEQKPSAQSSGPRPRMLEELLELRDLLRRIVEAVAAELDVPTRDVKRLNAFLEWADVRHRVHKTPEGLSLETVPLVEADKWLPGAIALSAAEFLASGDRSRLKTMATRDAVGSSTTTPRTEVVDGATATCAGIYSRSAGTEVVTGAVAGDRRAEAS